MKNVVQKLCFSAIMLALCYLLTTFCSIPLFSGNGYLHFGDTIILISALYVGPVWASLVGSGAGVLADLTLGQLAFIPVTIIAKIGMAVLAFLLAKIFKGKLKVIALAISVLWMIACYFVGSLIIYEKSQVALLNLGFDFIQGIVAVLLTLILTIKDLFHRFKNG